MTVKQGQIMWMEFHSKDFATTQSFYERVFGWKFDSSMGPEYLMFDDGSGVVGGGFSKDTPVSTGSPLVYVWVDDLEKSLAQIAEAGGTQVKEKTEIPTVGWWGSFKDPSGNLVGLYETARKG